MNKRLRYIILLCLVFFTYQFASAQSASVKASIDSPQILIGESIHLTLEANVPLGQSVQWFSLDSLSHFEFIDRGKIDTVESVNGKVFRQLVTITSFDSGKWSIPALPLKVGDKEIYTDSLAVTVAYSSFDPKQDYHDIKDIIVVDNPFVKYINWILLGITVLSLLLVVYFLRRKAKAFIPPDELASPGVSPLQEALNALEQLHKQSIQTSADVKNYYTTLSDIVRQYWWRKTNWAARKKTSDELIQRLSETLLPSNEKIQLTQQLRMGDAVKFAKYIPSFEENNKAFEVTKKSIQSLDGILK